MALLNALRVGAFTNDNRWRAIADRGIPSLLDYVLVSQTEPRIEHFRRDTDGTWVYRATGPCGHVTLSNGAILDVDRIFRGAFDLPGD